MEQQRPRPNGGDHPEVNSYGTNDPEKQARIEQARREASEERRRDRARLEQLVERGLHPDDAEALIEFEHYVRDQQQAEQTAHATERAAAATGPETEATLRYQPRIYVVSPASQERGTQYGQWIDANQTAAELTTAISAVMASPQTAEKAPWAIRACEGFAGLDVNGFTDLELVAQLARGVAEHGAAYAAWVQIVGTADRDQLDRFDDLYVGSYDSPEAWAREVGEDLQWEEHLDQVVDPMLRPYLLINYVRFAQEQRYAWDVLQGVDGKTHIFMR